MRCQISRPENISATIADVSTNTVCTSALLANWPRFHASSSFFGVACSVLSPPVCDSAMAMPGSTRSHQLCHPQHVFRQPVQVIDDVLRHELHGQAKDTQPRDDANEETLRENIHLRHGASQHGKYEQDHERHRHHG